MGHIYAYVRVGTSSCVPHNKAAPACVPTLHTYAAHVLALLLLRVPLLACCVSSATLVMICPAGNCLFACRLAAVNEWGTQMDPEEKEKMEKRDWLAEKIQMLNTQLEGFEADVEKAVRYTKYIHTYGTHIVMFVSMSFLRGYGLCCGSLGERFRFECVVFLTANDACSTSRTACWCVAMYTHTPAVVSAHLRCILLKAGI